MSRTDCFAGRTDEGHLFVCPACRAEARMASAWKGLDLREEPVEADDVFVARVIRGARRDRALRLQRRFWAAAAAAALFSFFAGFAHERAARPAPSVEESYASLASPNALEGLIPN
jgi:hypothetical protein